MESNRFRNPLTNERFPDPFIAYRDGYYYTIYSGGDQQTLLMIAKTKRIDEGYRTPAKVVYTSEGGGYGYDFWAPELHYIDGSWYIYTCGDNGNGNYHNHRVIVFKGTTQDPSVPGNFVFMGVLDTGPYTSIDATIFRALNGHLYLCWSSVIEHPQKLFLGKMKNPYELETPGEGVLIAEPVYEWEGTIVEGPAVLVKNNTVSIVYSADAADVPTYCLGVLTCTNTQEEDCRNWVWEKTEQPVFSQTENVWGPGHCSFTKSPDGREDWMIYHSKMDQRPNDMYRIPWAVKIGWNGDTPVFPEPAAPGTMMEHPSGTII